MVVIGQHDPGDNFDCAIFRRECSQQRIAKLVAPRGRFNECFVFVHRSGKQIVAFPSLQVGRAVRRKTARDPLLNEGASFFWVEASVFVEWHSVVL